MVQISEQVGQEFDNMTAWSKQTEKAVPLQQQEEESLKEDEKKIWSEP